MLTFAVMCGYRLCLIDSGGGTTTRPMEPVSAASGSLSLVPCAAKRHARARTCLVQPKAWKQTMDAELLERAARFGIETQYHDGTGQLRTVAGEVLGRLVGALGRE